MSDEMDISLTLKVNRFSGFSGIYTKSVMDEIETVIRNILDDKIGYFNDKGERNYSIEKRVDF